MPRLSELRVLVVGDLILDQYQICDATRLSPEAPVPIVLDKAQEHMALHTVELAEKHSIPLIENIPLARALYHQVEPGQLIPESLFEPVAELLRVVMDISYD